MAKESVAFFLPTRKGSERVKNKNTRPFACIQGGLIENKLSQLIQSTQLDEIIISSNDEECMEIASRYAEKDSRIRIIPRPDVLCLSSTNLQDLIKYVPTITTAKHILWGHVTTPLVDAKIYDAAIETYLEYLRHGYDSLIGVSELKNFILNQEGQIINNSTNLPWPRTQDLSPLYEINHSIFLTSREIYLSQQNRVGNKPYLYSMNKLHSYDIDWPEDFVIAELLYYHLFNS